MAKKGSALATIGLDYSAFEAGAKAVMKLSEQMGTFLRDTLAVAAGNVIASAFTKGAGAIVSFFTAMKNNLANIFTTGEELANLAHATGMATGAYLQFKTATEKNISMSEAANLLGRNAEIMEKDASLFRDISLKLFGVGERIQGFWLGVADKIAPVINPLLDRLLALDLSQWGQDFAAPIADAVAIIAQLAMDGQLWQTMGELAAAAFTYAAEVFGKVLELFTYEGFMAGLALIWVGIKQLGTYLYEVLQDAFSRLVVFFASQIFTVLNTCAAIVDNITVMIGDALNKIIKYETFGAVDTRAGIMDSDEQDRRAQERAKQAQDALDSIPASKPNGDPTKPRGSILDELKNILASTSFGSPELLDKLQNALEKFEKNSVAGASKNSNTAASQNFGVSSLAAVGGGGGVGFVSLTEHAAQQTSLQREINDNVKQMVFYAANRGNSGSAPPVYYASAKAAIR
jgi:hypothetical protein